MRLLFHDDFNKYFATQSIRLFIHWCTPKIFTRGPKQRQRMKNRTYARKFHLKSIAKQYIIHFILNIYSHWILAMLPTLLCSLFLSLCRSFSHANTLALTSRVVDSHTSLSLVATLRKYKYKFEM